MEHTGRDTLDTATASQTTNGGLGDTLNVVTENLAMTLGTALAETLASLKKKRIRTKKTNNFKVKQTFPRPDIVSGGESERA